MADYEPLIARAVDGLGTSTGEARRALYERARSALVSELRGVDPPLSEVDITRERLALEDAIRKVEALTVRAYRFAPRAEPPAADPLEELTPVSAKKRALLTGFGFFERAFNLMGSIAALVATEEGKAWLERRRRCSHDRDQEMRGRFPGVAKRGRAPQLRPQGRCLRQ